MRCFLRSMLRVCVLLVVASLARGQCPTNYGEVGVFDCGDFASTAAARSLAADCGPPGFGSVSYDLTQGTFAANVQSFGDIGSSGWVRASDVFFIDGPSVTEPIAISVQLTADFTNTRGGSEVHLVTVADSLMTSRTPSHQVLRLSLLERPGEHFLVGAYVMAFAILGSRSSVTASLAFGQLPAGYVLSSCQGYAGVPVSTRSETWGRLKAAYR